MSTELLAPIMFGSLIIMLLIGYPVAFSLAAVGLVFSAIAMNLGLIEFQFLQALPVQVFDIMKNEVMLAIPFFTFMGLILEKSGMAEAMLDTIGQLFGGVRGGLAYAVIFVGALLAATTGVVAASVISMGLIALPIMLRYGYDKRLASGVIAASGTLAQIIPPSLVLIVLADQMQVDIAAMYKGALIPGLVLTGLYALYVLIVSIVKPAMVPALPPEARTLREPNGSTGLPSLLLLVGMGAGISVAFNSMYYGAVPTEALDTRIVASGLVGMMGSFVLVYLNKGLRLRLFGQVAERVSTVLMPPLLLIFLVLGLIFMGVATPTDGGAMGATGAMLLALMKRKLTVDMVRQAVRSTLKLTTFVVFILIGARVFRIAFLAVDGNLWVEHLLLSLPGGATGFLITVMVLVFVIAFFLDFFEISFILVPLLMPVAHKLGVDPIWFGVLLAVNMQTSFMHPPFGFALFYLRSVAPKEVKTSDIYWGAVPFVGIQILMIALVLAFPGMAIGNKEKGPETLSTEKAGDVLMNLQQPEAPAAQGNTPASEEPQDDGAAALEALAREGAASQ